MSNDTPKTVDPKKTRKMRSRDTLAVDSIMRCNLRELALAAETLAKRDDMVARHFVSLVTKALDGGN